MARIFESEKTSLRLVEVREKGERQCWQVRGRNFLPTRGDGAKFFRGEDESKCEEEKRRYVDW